MVLNLIRREVILDEENVSQTDRAEEEVTAEGGDSAPNEEEHVIVWIVYHSHEIERWHFKVKWYGIVSANNTYDPIEGLLRISVMRY